MNLNEMSIKRKLNLVLVGCITFILVAIFGMIELSKMTTLQKIERTYIASTLRLKISLDKYEMALDKADHILAGNLLNRTSDMSKDMGIKQLSKLILQQPLNVDAEVNDFEEMLFTMLGFGKVFSVAKEAEVVSKKVITLIDNTTRDNYKSQLTKLNNEILKLEDIGLRFSLQLPEASSFLINLMLLIVFITAIVVVGLLIIVKIGLNKNVHSLQNGLLGFFAYLNKEKTKIDLLDDSSGDELGTMAKVINQNIIKTKEVLEEDDAVLADAKIVLGRMKHGWYSQHIEKSTRNESLNAFKNDVNDTIKATKANFNIMNTILEQYASLDYRNELVVDNVEKGGVFDLLITDINKLRNSITSMLVENKSNGLTLQNSSNILLENVSTLSNAANQSAASLEETAAALEEVTSTIVSNTQNVVQMSTHGKDVITASTQGQELANQTAVAMDEINIEVQAISEAITAIDQISFQTNILSLNAAVEAATAGEAGKGFAVVAQEVRNLASRSADSANEIKELVQNAMKKANNGKNITTQMIEGYTHLNESITKTIDLIGDVEIASKEQQTGVEQINDAITKLDQQTQENANAANATKDVAEATQSIAIDIVEDADKKEFSGKDSVKVKNMHNAKTQSNPTIQVPKKREKANTSKQVIKTITSNTNNDEWASF